MTRAAASPDVATRLGQRLAATGVLSSAYLLAQHRWARPHGDVPRRERRIAAATTAFAGPLLTIGCTVIRGDVRWQPPPSTLGRLMLGGYVAGAALFEELLWRAPVTVPRTARGTAGLAAASAAGFMALHLRRDGAASARAHLLTTTSWTGSTLLGHRLRWPVLSHALYNYAALTLRARPEPDR